MKKLTGSNCSKCREYFKEQCVEEENGACICKKCPRNLYQCIITKWCKETESPLECC